MKQRGGKVCLSSAFFGLILVPPRHLGSRRGELLRVLLMKQVPRPLQIGNLEGQNFAVLVDASKIQELGEQYQVRNRPGIERERLVSVLSGRSASIRRLVLLGAH